MQKMDDKIAADVWQKRGGPLFNFQYRWGRANFLVEIVNISMVFKWSHKILAPTGSEIREER